MLFLMGPDKEVLVAETACLHRASFVLKRCSLTASGVAGRQREEQAFRHVHLAPLGINILGGGALPLAAPARLQARPPPSLRSNSTHAPLAGPSHSHALCGAAPLAILPRRCPVAAGAAEQA